MESRGVPKEILNRSQAWRPTPYSFFPSISPRCPPQWNLNVVIEKTQLHANEIKLELIPNLNKGSIFNLLAVDVCLFPSHRRCAIKEKTSQANLRWKWSFLEFDGTYQISIYPRGRAISGGGRVKNQYTQKQNQRKHSETLIWSKKANILILGFIW